MVNVRDVASWFLSKSTVTHKKLQKLCYYAQAWYCALIDDGPLFIDDIQAWVHGPVIPALYPLYADYKWNEIPKVEFDEKVFPDPVRRVLEAVYNTYGKFSGDQLEALAHNELPWREARHGLGELETSTEVITCLSMKDYYAEKYQKSQND